MRIFVRVCVQYPERLATYINTQLPSIPGDTPFALVPTPPSHPPASTASSTAFSASRLGPVPNYLSSKDVTEIYRVSHALHNP